jgi:hypothetical protein
MGRHPNEVEPVTVRAPVSCAALGCPNPATLRVRVATSDPDQWFDLEMCDEDAQLFDESVAFTVTECSEL